MRFCPDTPLEDEARDIYSFRPKDYGLNPPIASHLLTHLLERPWEAEVIANFYNSIPKKLHAKLKEGEAGWGIQLVEGLDLFLVFVLGCVGFAFSLVIAMYWSIAKNDIQSGFTICGYILSFIVFCIGIAQLEISLSNPVFYRERPRESRR